MDRLYLGGIGQLASSSRVLLAVLVGMRTLPLAVRRARPLLVAALVWGAIVAQVVLVGPQLSLLAGLVPLLIVTYSGAAYAGRSSGFAALPGALAVQGVFVVRIPEERAAGEVLFGLFVIVGAWLVGDVVRGRQHRADRGGGRATGPR